jgi:hypothetical protein
MKSPDSVSLDLRLLLRADSIFRSPTSTEPLFYPRVFPGVRYGQDCMILRFWDINQVRRNNVARKFAQALLGCLGMENAIYVRMKGYGNRFICGRCYDRNPKDWEGIVGDLFDMELSILIFRNQIRHYLKHQNIWETKQEYIENLEADGIPVNHVHGLGFESEKPMVTLLSSERANKYASVVDPPVIEDYQYMCTLCEMYGAFRFKGVIAHVQDV